jgi:DNA-directed RNA polymerase subunit RPC12/RpoP
MGFLIHVALECEWCGYEVSEEYYDTYDVPEGPDFADDNYFRTTEMNGYGELICEDCSNNIMYCEPCDCEYSQDDMLMCDDEEYRCEDCADTNHREIQDELEEEDERQEEWVCESCGVRNMIYLLKPTWEL